MKRLADLIARMSPEVRTLKAAFDQMHYDAAADALWETDPKAAFMEYGLPCWCGHYGGCAKCDSVLRCNNCGKTMGEHGRLAECRAKSMEDFQ